MELNYEEVFTSVTDAIVALPVGALAKEAGANLVEHWIRERGEDLTEEIAGVEMGFILQLTPQTYVIGVQDLVTRDADGYKGSEWKTTSESKFWKEANWLEEITAGPQIATYALALREATYYPAGTTASLKFAEPSPRIRVRAIVKTDPPKFWPIDEEEGTIPFSSLALESIRGALLSKAAQIRASRAEGVLPWAWPGKHCRSFGRLCQFYGDCSKYQYAALAHGFDPQDPAAGLALPNIPREVLEDPGTVVLSASSFSAHSECAEKYRRLAAGGPKDESSALDIGTCFHAGVAVFYRMAQACQIGNNPEK